MTPGKTIDIPAGLYKYNATVNNEGIGDIEGSEKIDYMMRPGTIFLQNQPLTITVDYRDYVPVQFIGTPHVSCFTEILDNAGRVRALIGGEQGISGNFIVYCPVRESFTP